MVCIFCLNETSDNVSLYGASELAKHARNVVTKHFWFDIHEINTAGKYACADCWQKLESFYNFHSMVELNYPNILNVIDAKNDLVSQPLDSDTKLFDKETVIVKVENDGLCDVKVEINEIAVEPNDNSNAVPAPNDSKKFEKKANRNTSNALPTFQENKKTEKFSCQVCRRQFSKSGLAHHMPVHDPEESFILECDLCGKKFSRKLTILRHFYSHQRYKNRDKTKLRAPCPICKKELSRSNITTHILKMHKNVRNLKYMCEVCGKGFEAPSMLAQHVVTHADRSLTEVQCNICGKWQKNQHSLNSHKRKVHKQEPMKCDQCDEIVYSTNEMKVHTAQFHSMRKHQCSICKKAFIRPIRLREHIASVHTGERAYDCLYCRKTFKSNSNRFTHVKNHHLREYNLNREKKNAK